MAILPRAAPGRTARLLEVARLFLRLGLTAFGGPAAYIAMMEDEVVARRRWVTREEFLDRLGRGQPDSTADFNRSGHVSRLPARGVAGLGRGLDMLHRSGGGDGVVFRIGLRAVRHPATGGTVPLRAEANGDRNHCASAVDAEPDGG
jgi:hypothetical protein